MMKNEGEGVMKICKKIYGELKKKSDFGGPEMTKHGREGWKMNRKSCWESCMRSEHK